MRARHVALLLTGGPSARTVTALQLADRLLARGHRVTVYAHGEAASVSAAGSPLEPAVGALLHRGVHGATLDWVVDGASAPSQAQGVVPGDPADLWAFVRQADVVLSPGRG